MKKRLGPKKNETYQLLSDLNKEIESKNPTSLMNNFGIKRNTAKRLYVDKMIARKPRERRITHKLIGNIDKFYKRGDISTVDPSKKSASRKKGAMRYMRFSFREAYVIFKQENPKVKISLSRFYELRPENITSLANTPLLGCLCIYCANVKLKLAKLDIPGIQTEHELYNRLICKKENENQEYRNSNCIFHECNKCSNWESTIMSLVACKLNDKIEWREWVTKDYMTKNDKPSKRKFLEIVKGTVKDCTEQLINVDIMKPNSGFTFVKHYSTQLYQHKQYAKCKENLENGEIIAVQDFSNNIDCTPQDEIKAAHWSAVHVTAHPSVLEAKIPGKNELHKAVITHLSDIKTHDAHMVYHITMECINYFRENFPEVIWKKNYLWSDGCASQYKGKTSFWYLKNFENINIERIFFGSEHGKNESDGVTGQISRTVHDAIKSQGHI